MDKQSDIKLDTNNRKRKCDQKTKGQETETSIQTSANKEVEHIPAKKNKTTGPQIISKIQSTETNSEPDKLFGVNKSNNGNIEFNYNELNDGSSSKVIGVNLNDCETSQITTPQTTNTLPPPLPDVNKSIKDQNDCVSEMGVDEINLTNEINETNCVEIAQKNFILTKETAISFLKNFMLNLNNSNLNKISLY